MPHTVPPAVALPYRKRLGCSALLVPGTASSRSVTRLALLPLLCYTAHMPLPVTVVPSFLFYCYISAITPGPANICSLSTALRCGKKAALQQWLGIFIGFAIVAFAAVCIVYFVGTALNGSVGYLSFVGAAYLVYLALHTLRQDYAEPAEGGDSQQGGSDSAQEERRLFRQNLLAGILVQLTNVKIMLLCLTALGSYVLPYSSAFADLLAVGLFLPFTGPVANLVWLFAGLSLQRLFARHRRAVNIVMAVLLLLCALSLIIKP